MKIHPREALVREAENKIRLVYVEALKGLTTCEAISVVNHMAFTEIGGMMKFAIREERHGDTDKPGGLA